MSQSRSNPGVAAVLSLIVPGVGQIYNGAFLRGIFWLIITPGFWIGSGGTLGWVCHLIAAYTAYSAAGSSATSTASRRRSAASRHSPAPASVRNATTTSDEITAAGWLNADLLYKGLVAAGPEFTQQSVIDAINQMQWDADGMIPGVDWTIGHESDPPETCVNLVKIEDGEFVPQLQQPGKPYLCFDRDAATLPEQPENRAGLFR